MPDFYFFPVDGADVQPYANAYLDQFQPRRRHNDQAILNALPPLLEIADVLSRINSDERTAVERYLKQQRDAFEARAAEMTPQLPGVPVAGLEFVALDGPWRGHDAGTIGCVRRSNSGGLLALFDEWSIDASARLAHVPVAVAWNKPSVPLDDRDALVANEIGTQAAKHVGDVVLQLLNYVGQGLSMTGMPAAGLVLSFISSLSQQYLDEGLSQSSHLLDEIATLLEASKISLELDLAKAQITTYHDYMVENYNDAWLKQVMTGDQNSTDTKEKLEKLRKFTAKITSDFDSTSPLFTAVNLMREDSPTVGSDIDKPSEAMYKACGFFYLANFVLTLGRQAFNAQLTMEGPDDSRKVAELLAAKSALYTAFARSLKAVVDQQVEHRVGLIGFGPAEGGRASISDKTVFNPRIYDSDYDYSTDYNWFQNCCGESDCAKAASAAEAMLPQLRAKARTEYRAYLCAKFWNGSSGSFDSAVAQMIENDKRLQALITSAGGAS